MQSCYGKPTNYSIRTLHLVTSVWTYPMHHIQHSVDYLLKKKNQLEEHKGNTKNKSGLFYFIYTSKSGFFCGYSTNIFCVNSVTKVKPRLIYKKDFPVISIYFRIINSVINYQCPSGLASVYHTYKLIAILNTRETETGKSIINSWRWINRSHQRESYSGDTCQNAVWDATRVKRYITYLYDGRSIVRFTQYERCRAREQYFVNNNKQMRK